MQENEARALNRGASPSGELVYLRQAATQAARGLYPQAQGIPVEQLIKDADAILKYWQEGTQQG